MSKVMDVMHDWLTKLKEKPSEFLDKEFMLGWFDEFKTQLKPFDEYWEATFSEEKQPVRCRRTHAIVASLGDVLDEAFCPQNIQFQECKNRLLELVPRVVNGLLEELEDKRKVAWKHLSKFGEEHIEKFSYSLSWEYSTPKMKKLMEGWRANNSITESALGSITEEMHTHGRIGIGDAAAVSDARRNGIMGMKRVTDEEGKVSWKRGFVAEQDPRIADCLMEAARRHVHEMRQENRNKVQAYVDDRRNKRIERLRKVEEKVEEKMVKGFDYYTLFHKSGRCVRDENEVDDWLKQFSSKGKKWML